MIDTQSIWAEFREPLEGFLRRRVSDPVAVQDLLQDIFLRIHTRVDGLRDQERVAAWVYQIARNIVVDYYRSRGQAPPPLSLDTVELPAAEPEDNDLTRAVGLSLRRMIDDLPEEYRQALLLTEVRGLTQKEAAARLGISLSGAKSRVQRGREKLKALLADCCHVEFDRTGKVLDYYPVSVCCTRCCEK